MIEGKITMGSYEWGTSSLRELKFPHEGKLPRYKGKCINGKSNVTKEIPSKKMSRYEG
jgi:hypothetical protein